jgi:hypothetical protein
MPNIQLSEMGDRNPSDSSIYPTQPLGEDESFNAASLDSLSLSRPFPRISHSNGGDNGKEERTSLCNSQSKQLREVSFGSIDLLETWFPEINPAHRTSRSRRSRRQTMLWTVLSSLAFVLVFNIIALIVFMAKYHPERGVVSIYEGSCALVKRVDLIFHIFINILSTLLLGASNVSMQLLVAPTRKEIDHAHRPNIGVPSLRNLSRIHWFRRVFWLALGASSIPVHFIYNSAMSTSIPEMGVCWHWWLPKITLLAVP